MILIPLFPLEIVVFPEEQLNLHIFEPRYKQLIEDVEKNQMPFGIPYYRDGVPLSYGTMVQLEQIVNKFADGRMDIQTRGINPFEIKRYSKTYTNKLYPGGHVDEKYWDKEGNTFPKQKKKNKNSTFFEYMKINDLPKGFEKDFISFDIAHKIGLSIEQEFELLQIPGENDRQLYILNHLERIVPLAIEMERMRKIVQMNGHFKHIVPPKI